MFDFSILSTKYKVKKMGEEDAPIIFNLLSGNPLYFEYCPPKPSIESVLNDLRALPPGKSLIDKFYLGFFNDNQLSGSDGLYRIFPTRGHHFHRIIYGRY